MKLPIPTDLQRQHRAIKTWRRNHSWSHLGQCTDAMNNLNSFGSQWMEAGSLVLRTSVDSLTANMDCS